jgi:hypothetical protein
MERPHELVDFMSIILSSAARVILAIANKHGKPSFTATFCVILSTHRPVRNRSWGEGHGHDGAYHAIDMVFKIIKDRIDRKDCHPPGVIEPMTWCLTDAGHRRPGFEHLTFERSRFSGPCCELAAVAQKPWW